MAEESNPELGLAWSWAIALLSPCIEFDTGLLNELIAMAPMTMSPLDDDARARLILDCLDGPCAISSSENWKDALNVFESGIEILKVAGQGLFRENILSHITEKGSSLPKCTLQLKLKDLYNEIAEGQKNVKDISSDDDAETDIARMKQSFFSQYGLTSMPCETAELSVRSICVKCNEGGRLLVCSSTACPLVVHEICLVSSPCFDADGNFYCPFCSYSHAISDYREAKKKSFLAREGLAEFMGPRDMHLENKIHSEGLHEAKRHGDMSQVLEGTTREELQGQVQADLEGKVDDQRHAEIGVRKDVSQDCVGDRNQDRALNLRNIDCGKNSEWLAEELNNQVQAVPCTSEKMQEELHDQVQAVSKRNASIHRHSEVETHEQALQHASDPRQVQDSEPENMDHEGASEEENYVPTTAHYSMRQRKRKMMNSSPAIPRVGRKKNPWTAAEEEMLKEGVRRFASDGKFPWQQILEFGASGFQKGRTAVDLKDKWRNICKASSKIQIQNTFPAMRTFLEEG